MIVGINPNGQIHRRKYMSVISPVASEHLSGKTCVPDIEKGILPVAPTFKERTTAYTTSMIEPPPLMDTQIPISGQQLVRMIAQPPILRSRRHRS